MSLDTLLCHPPPGAVQSFDEITVPLALRFEAREQACLQSLLLASGPMGAGIALLSCMGGLDAASASAMGLLLSMVSFSLVMNFFLMPREDRVRVSPRGLTLGERTLRMSDIASIRAGQGPDCWLEIETREGRLHRWRADPTAACWLVEVVEAFRERHGQASRPPELERLRVRANAR